MNDIAEDIKDYLLTNESLYLEFGVNLFIAKEPMTPDQCTTLISMTGFSDDLMLSYSDKVDNPSLRIRVRATSYEAGESLINDIRDFLQGKGNIIINGMNYMYMRCTIPPYQSGWDKPNRRISFDTMFRFKRSL